MPQVKEEEIQALALAATTMILVFVFKRWE